MITRNVWASVLKFSRDIIADIKLAGIADPQLIDWETHANQQEYPLVDLLGPSALTVTEMSPQMMEVSFAIGASSYDDENLFRQRDMIDMIFERMRPERELALYDSTTTLVKGWMKFRGGTLMAPMSRSDARPWQYVQASALVEPTSTS